MFKDGVVSKCNDLISKRFWQQSLIYELYHIYCVVSDTFQCYSELLYVLLVLLQKLVNLLPTVVEVSLRVETIMHNDVSIVNASGQDFTGNFSNVLFLISPENLNLNERFKGGNSH